MHHPHVRSFKRIILHKTLSRIHSVEKNKKLFLLLFLSLLKQPPFFLKNMSYWNIFLTMTMLIFRYENYPLGCTIMIYVNFSLICGWCHIFMYKRWSIKLLRTLNLTRKSCFSPSLLSGMHASVCKTEVELFLFVFFRRRRCIKLFFRLS